MIFQLYKVFILWLKKLVIDYCCENDGEMGLEYFRNKSLYLSLYKYWLFGKEEFY